ncbi:mitochondrial ribosomal protein S7 isoform X2 [Nomia melanderi]|uniref:mitochondrial ribosomal protein S7 isoform X2 n=1 Tax=Nomia melanderi TaxID=2448451 RepID=UPI003FCE90D4
MIYSASLCGYLYDIYIPTNIWQHYSLYPSSYIKPIYRKDEQDEIFQNEKEKNIHHTPVKAALTSDTSSEFYDTAINKFLNYLMRHGNKVLSRKLLESTFENIKMLQLQRYNAASPEEKQFILLDPKQIFHRAVENCTPILEIKKIKKGGIFYQVPVPLTVERSRFLAMNWLIQIARDKDDNLRYPVSLAKEMIDAANNKGRVIKRKHDLHKLCEANRAYAHFRWM